MPENPRNPNIKITILMYCFVCFILFRNTFFRWSFDNTFDSSPHKLREQVQTYFQKQSNMSSTRKCSHLAREYGYLKLKRKHPSMNLLGGRTKMLIIKLYSYYSSLKIFIKNGLEPLDKGIQSSLHIFICSLARTYCLQ